jgi:hypothetical protein
MRVMVKLGWLLLLYIPIPAFAQRASGVGLVRLQPVHEISDGLDAWPLIVNPKNDAERRINGTLDSYNAETQKTLPECEEWDRKISVTMAGPRYLSLQASGSIFCGGGHPDPYDIALVFDLATGELLNGSTVIEKNSDMKTTATKDLAHYPQSDKFLLSSPELDRILIAAANDNCKESLQDVEHDSRLSPFQYSIWPDAKKNQVVVKPVSLSYLNYLMCSEEIDIPLDQAHKLGFSKSFLQAIDEAHRAILRP